MSSKSSTRLDFFNTFNNIRLLQKIWGNILNFIKKYDEDGFTATHFSVNSAPKKRSAIAQEKGSEASSSCEVIMTSTL